jgi:RepB DNA-primase from phage plasmid
MERLFRKLGRYFLGGWRLAVLDLQKGRWIVQATASNIHYLKAENANGRHILMQPMDASRYLLVDDLNRALLCRHHRHADGTWKPGRMVIETSPRNYQVWIHSQRPLSLMEKRYWLKKLMNDPGADPNNRWGRCPGFRNRKDKHRSACGRYPLARLIWIDWMTQAQIPQILLEPPVHSKPFSHQPQRGGVCRHTKELSRSDFDRGNESATDFSYALALARGGHTEDQIRSRILSERACWKNHQGQRKIHQYLDRTIRRAKTIVAKT